MDLVTIVAVTMIVVAILLLLITIRDVVKNIIINLVAKFILVKFKKLIYKRSKLSILNYRGFSFYAKVSY
jgi:hypothetical protein